MVRTKALCKLVLLLLLLVLLLVSLFVFNGQKCDFYMERIFLGIFHATEIEIIWFKIFSSGGAISSVNPTTTNILETIDFANQFQLPSDKSAAAMERCLVCQAFKGIAAY